MMAIARLYLQGFFFFLFFFWSVSTLKEVGTVSGKVRLGQDVLSPLPIVVRVPATQDLFPIAPCFFWV